MKSYYELEHFKAETYELHQISRKLTPIMLALGFLYMRIIFLFDRLQTRIENL